MVDKTERSSKAQKVKEKVLTSRLTLNLKLYLEIQRKKLDLKKKNREKELFYNEVEINYRDEKGLRREKARLSERYDMITGFIPFFLKKYYQY